MLGDVVREHGALERTPHLTTHIYFTQVFIVRMRKTHTQV
jgi:hypothetical protein